MIKKIKVGSDFSGVGAFDQALKRLKIDYQTIYACDWDKYARETFIHNYGEPEYYPKDVYEREIPSESLDIYMTSPPCQSFSLAGKRLGKDDKRGVLFFNSHEFIQVNKPKFFIFENVKGLLSDDNGKTFSEWVAMLGGKSVNGNPVLFPYEDSVPYHLYWKVLNAKEHGIPQNRERVFLVGIRDDKDNNFRFPVEEHLTKRLKNVLENSVDDKYFLSEKTIENLLVYNERQKENERGFSAKFRDVNEIKIMDALKVGGGGKDDLIKIKSATSTGFEIATDGDSINLSQINSKTRRGRVGDQVAQTLDTACNQAILAYSRDNKGKVISRHIKYESNTIHTATGGGGNTDQFVIGTWRTHKDGQGFREIEDGNCPTIPARAREDESGQPVIQENFKIRRLTPRECFRLMDFPDSFTWPVSDSQAYKQAGNSIVVNVLVKIIKNLNL
jgi:DNA (cytosine-5)-methyltransferase 1